MHAAVPIGGHSILLFGGVSRKEGFDETENLEATMSRGHLVICHQTFRVATDGYTWQPVHNNGDVPTSRATHTMVLFEGNAYTFGSHLKNDATLYVFNVAFNQWRKIDTSAAAPSPNRGNGAPQTAPLCPSGHSAILASRSMVVFGGECTNGFDIDVYVLHFDDRVWCRFPPSGPLIDAGKKSILRRRDHSAVIVQHRMFVYGGFGVKSDELEFVAFNATTQQWEAPLEVTGTVPPLRGGHVCHVYQEFMFLFGGQRHGCYLNDLHVLDLGTMVWTGVALIASPTVWIPSPRSHAAHAAVGSDLYIHGGSDDVHIYSDFVKLDMLVVARKINPAVSAAAKDRFGPTKDWDTM